MNTSKNQVHFEDQNYKDILNQTNKKCFYCGRFDEHFYIEDVRSEYSIYFDYVCVCGRCHKIKGNKSIHEYKEYILDILYKLKKGDLTSLFFELELLYRTDKHVLFYGERISESKGTDTEVVMNIKRQVAQYYSLTPKKLDSPNRTRDVVWARQVAHFFARNKSNASLNFIANEIGRVNHATILHSIKTVRNLYDTDPRKKKDIDFLNKVFDSVI